jgi:hypothetical protein
MNKQKITYLAIGIIIIVAAFILWQVQKNPNQETSQQLNPPPIAESQNTATEPPPAPAPEQKAPTKTPTKPVMSYTEAVKAYEGHRIQFDNACQATPFSVTYKVGTKLMFDNRSNQTRKITIDGKSYSIPAYGYQIITFNNLGTKYANCDTSKNVLTVLIQK